MEGFDLMIGGKQRLGFVSIGDCKGIVQRQGIFLSFLFLLKGQCSPNISKKTGGKLPPRSTIAKPRREVP